MGFMGDFDMLMYIVNVLQIQCFPNLSDQANYFVEYFAEHVLGDASLFTNCATSKKLFNVFEPSFLIFKKATKYLIGLVSGGGQSG